MEKTGVCPIASEELLGFALNALKAKGALRNLPEESYRKEADALGKLLPDSYLPDIYLDLPLMGGDFRGMAAVMDCFDRCYVGFASKGEYFQDTGLPALDAPENRDDLLVFRAGGSEGMKHGCQAPMPFPDDAWIPGTHASFFTIERKLPDTARLLEADEELAGIPGASAFTEFPLKYRKVPLEDGLRLTLTTGNQDAKNRFTQKPWKEELLRLLSEAGCEEDALKALDNACFNCGVPYLHPVRIYWEWVVCLDVAAFEFVVRGGQVIDCHAVIRISDKSKTYAGTALKPLNAYQWHITDSCDQRCKHCYIFAENAKLKCMDTPWDQLMLTLDELERNAAGKGTNPLPVIGGGDPILHPEFWRFAEELHRRGLRWVIMGNPFHLSEETCRQLYRLGCIKYQMSLDGLEPFHDRMRKPGSYKATLKAIGLLNDAGIWSQLMATASRLNLEDILCCMDIAVEHRLGSFSFARYCATSPEKAEDYPTPQEYRDFLHRYYQKAREYKAKGCTTSFSFKEHLFTLVRYELGEFEPTEFSKEHPDRIFGGCHLGQGLAILANGDLMACRRMQSVVGNVKSDSIGDAEGSELCQSYRDIGNIKKCKDCELGQWCRGCRAVGFNATGDLQAADPCCWKA